MERFFDFDSFSRQGGGSVIALGNFDGVHRGHQAIIRLAGDTARENGGILTVVTFSPHPRAYFNPKSPPFEITPTGTKLTILEELDVPRCLVIPFDADVSGLSPWEFSRSILKDRLHALHVVVGFNFHFGKGRTGNAESLERLSSEMGFDVSVAIPVEHDGVPISSTRLRSLIAGGDIAAARAVTGRWPRIHGPVVSGDNRGTALGFPTANFSLGDQLSPRHGVYAALATIDGDASQRRRPGVANIGTSPTFNGKGPPRCELHIPDFDEDIRGRQVLVELLSWIRAEQAFPGPEELKTQIRTDITSARRSIERLEKKFPESF